MARRSKRREPANSPSRSPRDTVDSARGVRSVAPVSLTPPLPAWAAWGLPILVFIASFAAYGPALTAEFVNWDDDKNITENYSFRGLSGKHLGWMFTTGKMGHYQPLSWLTFGIDTKLWGLTGPKYPEASRFHLTNVLLHACGALAFYLLALRLLSIAAPPPDGVGSSDGRLRTALAAAAAALLFGIHPLRVESVAWVTERRDVLSGIFFILTIAAYVRGAPRTHEARFRIHWYLAAGALTLLTITLFMAAVDTSSKFNLQFRPGVGNAGFALLFMMLAAFAATVLAVQRAVAYPLEGNRGGRIAAAVALLSVSLFAKAWGMVIPVILLVLDIWPLQRWRTRYVADDAAASRRAARSADRRVTPSNGPGRPGAAIVHLVLEKTPFFILTIVFARLAHWAQWGQLDTMKTWEEHTLVERMAQAFHGLAFYPLKTLLPTGLMPIYELPEALSPIQPPYLFSMLAVLAVTAALLLLARRFPAGIVAWACFGVIVSPVLGVQQSGPQLVADRYSYLSCMPFALLAAGLLLAGSYRGAAVRRAAVPLAAALVGVSAVLTWRQATAWQSSRALWEHTNRINPDSYTACLNLGIIRKQTAEERKDPVEKRALLEEALRLYDHGFQLDPGNPRFPTNSANVCSMLADLEPARRREHLDRAIEYTRRALEVAQRENLELAEIVMNYGVVLMKTGRLADAHEQFLDAVRKKPDLVKARSNVGMTFTRLGRPEEALPHLHEAVRLEPNYINAWINLAEAYEVILVKQPAGHPGHAATRTRLIDARLGLARAYEQVAEQHRLAAKKELAADARQNALRVYEGVLQLDAGNATALERRKAITGE